MSPQMRACNVPGQQSACVARSNTLPCRLASAPLQLARIPWHNVCHRAAGRRQWPASAAGTEPWSVPLLMSAQQHRHRLPHDMRMGAMHSSKQVCDCVVPSGQTTGCVQGAGMGPAKLAFPPTAWPQCPVPTAWSHWGGSSCFLCQGESSQVVSLRSSPTSPLGQVQQHPQMLRAGSKPRCWRAARPAAAHPRSSNVRSALHTLLPCFQSPPSCNQ